MQGFAIDHIHYRSLNPEGAAAWWREMFGAVEAARVMNGDKLRVVMELAGLKIFIEEVPAGTGAPPPAPFLGLEHLGLTVGDMDATVARITAQGGKLAKPISSPRPNVRICFVEAPDGATVELIERK
ncbi:VOC family protein [Rhodovarius lipocyclicus]|uniref:VOC family protein n=1 Tax=Rhodovarius lipocyclicus TaxID=268410 RepID=UPI00135B7671|nr:VOC family protein [Rhodovarius lipocyclicus]